MLLVKTRLCQYHTHIAYFMPSSDENLSTLHQTNFLFNTSTSLKNVKKCKIGKMRTRKPRNLAKTKTNHFSPSSSFLCSKMTYQISISDRTRWLEWILSRSLYCKVVRRLIWMQNMHGYAWHQLLMESRHSTPNNLPKKEQKPQKQSSQRN